MKKYAIMSILLSAFFITLSINALDAEAIVYRDHILENPKKAKSFNRQRKGDRIHGDFSLINIDRSKKLITGYKKVKDTSVIYKITYKRLAPKRVPDNNNKLHFLGYFNGLSVSNESTNKILIYVKKAKVY